MPMALMRRDWLFPYKYISPKEKSRLSITINDNQKQPYDNLMTTL
jgi:hypothetical protein